MRLKQRLSGSSECVNGEGQIKVGFIKLLGRIRNRTLGFLGGHLPPGEGVHSSEGSHRDPWMTLDSTYRIVWQGWPDREDDNEGRRETF